MQHSGDKTNLRVEKVYVTVSAFERTYDIDIVDDACMVMVPLEWTVFDVCKPISTVQTEPYRKRIRVSLTNEELYSYGDNIPLAIRFALEKSKTTLSQLQIERLYHLLLTWPNEYTNATAPKAVMSRPKEVDSLPGLKEIVKHPANPEFNSNIVNVERGYGRLESVIIDLNDRQQWTVNQIADWLDTLDIDLRLGQQEGKIDRSKDKWYALGHVGANDHFHISFDEFKSKHSYEAITIKDWKIYYNNHIKENDDDKG